MAALHSALAALGPEDFSNVPTSDEELDKYMSNLFSQCEVIIESIPLPPPPDEKISRARAQTVSSIASNASEISSSSLRSAPAKPEHQDLQTLWGKPIKLSAKDNPLGMSVYKTSGKDGRGSWFARRSVHEGLGYSRWQAALAREFPESMDTPGEPWDGNIRGIGGERKVEDRSIEGKGRIEVYQLSAKFPGPTTPRDFITLLVTSSKAIRIEDSSVPRHYMIVSKPCTHKDCPPRNDYIRGQYESVEFIREVPPDSSSSVDKDADPELNPIEWIMITRSDPGGSVPRFMVERGTPASICGDAVKFLNWATQLDHPDDEAAGDEEGPSRQPTLSKWETNAIMAGVNGGPEQSGERSAEQSPSNSGLLAAVNQGLEAYAPQAVLNYLPDHQPHQQVPQPQPSQPAAAEENETDKKLEDDDATSTMSSVSFASAESHVSTPNADGTPALPHHEKELQKLRERRETLDSKLEAAREKAAKETVEASAKEEDAAKKAQERHEKELKKQEEKYKKEVAKLEAKREKENKKMEERRKKLEEKDIIKQNETMKKEVEALKKERDTMLKMIGALTSENQHLAARLGETEKSASNHSVGSGGSVKSGRDVTPDLAPAAAAAALGSSTHKSANSISSVSKDQIKQLIEEENANREKEGRLRAQSLGSPGSDGRSRATSKSKFEQ